MDEFENCNLIIECEELVFNHTNAINDCNLLMKKKGKPDSSGFRETAFNIVSSTVNSEDMHKMNKENRGKVIHDDDHDTVANMKDEVADFIDNNCNWIDCGLEFMTQDDLVKVNETNDDVLDINDMPNEIILKVFSYLTQNQLGQIARVCRRWNVLKKSPLLWRKVNVKIFSSDTEKIAVPKYFINGLPSCVTFIRLDFAECENLDFEELCVKLHQNCPHVEELILTKLRMSNLLPEVINFCTQLLQCVKKLVFHYCAFYKNSGTVELNDNSNIEVLDLYGCEVSDCCKMQFSELLYLKELRLSCTNVDDTWFVDGASFFNRLHVLDLGWTRITDSPFLAIQNHGHNLKELYLCYCSLEDNHLNFNNFVFPHLKTICLFDLSSFSVTCEGVVSITRSCPSLENIYVNEEVAVSFASHPFVVANRCKSGIVKAIYWSHNHIVNYLQN